MICAPDYFLAKFPRDIALDGELWIGRGQFEETTSTVLSETLMLAGKAFTMVLMPRRLKTPSKSRCNFAGDSAQGKPLCQTSRASPL